MPPQFLTWVWKNFYLFPPLCNFWESNSSWLYSTCVVSQGMTFSLQQCLIFPALWGIYVQNLKGERNLTAPAQIVLFLPALSAPFPLASPSERLVDFQGGGGWEEVMLYHVQFSFLVIGLAFFGVLLCLVKDLCGCISGFDCVHRIVSFWMLKLRNS